MNLYRYSAAAILIVLATSGASNADFLGSPPIYHPQQGLAVCIVSNIGNATVSLAGVQILNGYDGSALTSYTENTCTSSLAKRQSCIVSVTLPAGNVHSCRISAPDGTNIRGTFEVRKSVYEPLVFSDVR
jgi:hypothetical protein